MIISIKLFKESLQLFDTSNSIDDIKYFQDNIIDYFNNGLNIQTIKELNIIKIDNGVRIEYDNMYINNDKSIIYTVLFKKLNSDLRFKCVGWKNFTIATLEYIIKLMFNKTYSQYKIEIIKSVEDNWIDVII